jgi:signal transduction histidine kinase
MGTEKKYDPPAIAQVELLSEKLIIINQKLEEKNRQLNRSEMARKKIFSNITHDLRAPVAVIRGAIERLYNDGIDETERLRMLKIIDSRAATLEVLIDDMHYSSIIEQPGFKLSPQKLVIALILEEYFITMEGAGRLDKRESVLNIPDGFSACISIDPKYFFRVLDNLFSNALTHTKKGDRIELGCRESKESVEIFLSDSGSGVPEELVPFLFERSFVGASARTPGKTGSGLGLSIARAIVEKHGGTIRCDSTQGEGSTFTVSMPIAK